MLAPQPYKPYKPYTPEYETIEKRIAGNAGNAAQGKTVTAAGAQQPYTTYGGVNIPQQYPYPAIQNPPYYQAPTPISAINEERAIENTPEQNREYARNVINAYKQFLGRLPDEPGYFSHLQRAINEKADWNTIANWLRTSEEGQRYQAMRDVGLQIDPELFSRQQAYQRWLAEQEYQKQYLAEQLRQGLERQQMQYNYQLEDLARAIAQNQRNARLESARRGLWHSGIMDAALQRIAEQEALARGRMGGEYQAAIGNLERTYGLNLGQLEQRMGLYGQQYNEAIAELMRRREALMSRALEQQLKERAEQEWRQRLFDWEREKFFTNLRAQLAMRGGGGYGGGYGGGGGGETPLDSYFGKAAELLRDIGGSDTTYENALNIVSMARMPGAVPGLNTYGMTEDQLMNLYDWMYANPEATNALLSEGYARMHPNEGTATATGGNPAGGFGGGGSKVSSSRLMPSPSRNTVYDLLGRRISGTLLQR